MKFVGGGADQGRRFITAKVNNELYSYVQYVDEITGNVESEGLARLEFVQENGNPSLQEAANQDNIDPSLLNSIRSTYVHFLTSNDQSLVEQIVGPEEDVIVVKEVNAVKEYSIIKKHELDAYTPEQKADIINVYAIGGNVEY